MSLFSVLVDIGANTANIEAGVDRVVQKFDALGTAAKSVGEIFSASLLVDITKNVINLGDALQTASVRAGVAGQAFSELVYDTKQSGVGIDQLSASFVKMNQQLSLASTGAKLPNEALTALGLTIKDLQGLSPDQQFEVLADRISKLATPADQARAAIDLFGRSGSELLPVLLQGAAGIEKMRGEADNLGAAFSDDTLKNLEAAHQSIDRLTSSFEGFAATLVGVAAPSISTFFDRLSGAISGDEIQKLNQEIEFLQQVQGEGFLSSGTGTYSDIPGGYNSATEGSALLRSLQGKLDMQSLILKPSQLQPPNMNDLLGSVSGPPGFLPNPLDQLQPVDVSKFRETPSQYTLPTATAAPSVLSQYDKATVDQLAAAEQKYSDTQADLNVLLASGAISQDTYNSRLSEASSAFTNLLDTKLPEFRVSMQKLPEIMSAADESIHDFVNTTKQGFEETLNESGSFGKNLLKNLLEAFANKELLNAIDNMGTAIEKALSPPAGGGILDTLAGSGLFGSGAQLGSTNYLNSLDNSTSSYLNGLDYSIPGFATGGAFMVGGSGGTDTQDIRFKASTGEKVSITKPGQRGSGASTISYSPVYNIGQGVSRADVISAADQTYKRTIADMTRLIKGGAFS